MSLLTVTLTLFLIMDSIGNINPYLRLVRELNEERQRHVVIREMLIALLLMVITYFFGELLLGLLDINQTAVQLSSGIVLFLIAIRMIFPSKSAPTEELPFRGEPFIVPIATPMIAGPSALMAVMLYGGENVSSYNVLIAILIAWGLSALILAFAIPIKNVLGDKTLVATERLMGLILTMLSVEMFLRGLQYLITGSAE